jgi:hypothetical protein
MLGPLIMKISWKKLSFDTMGRNRVLALLRLHSPPQFYKKGCRVEFTIKTLYLFKHVSKLCFIQWNHVNQNCLHVHGDFKMGDIYKFFAHLSQQIKDFVMEKLKLVLTTFQIMAKYKEHVKNIMLVICEFNKYMFLIE